MRSTLFPSPGFIRGEGNFELRIGNCELERSDLTPQTDTFKCSNYTDCHFKT